MKVQLISTLALLCLWPVSAINHGDKLSSKLSSFLGDEIKNRVLAAVDLTEDNEGHRSLAKQDFEDFREAFQDAVIKLPNFQATEQVLLGTFTMRAWNMECFDIMLGDMDITYALKSSTKLNFILDILEIDFRCRMDFSWDYGILSGGGNAYLDTDNNFASASFDFISEDFNSFPPSSSRLEGCGARLDVTDLHFSGSLSANLLNLFERRLSTFVENAVNDVACDELGALGTTMVEGFLDAASDLLNPYLHQEYPLSQLSPTHAEEMMKVPADVRLLNFRDDESSSAWFTSALKKADSALGARLYDKNSPYTDGKDLGVNILLREQILDRDRALSVSIADLPFDIDQTIFSGHDMLTETTMTLENVKIFGLDTFTHFAPFERIGDYTLKNELKWDYLLFEVDIKLLIKPSTQDDSIFTNVDPSKTLVEHAQVYFGVDDVDAVFSLLMAINEDDFANLEVGSLLQSRNVLPCFWSTLFQAEVTELNASVGNVREPELRGFISKGIDKVVTESVKAAFLMYENAVLDALPVFFQTDLMDNLNNIFFATYSEKCLQPPSSNDFIDFRDLVLESDESKKLGGSGTEPYGDLAPKIANFLKEQVTTVESDGMLSANSMMIDPLTSLQSGVAGKLHFPDELLRTELQDFSNQGVKALLESFHLSVSGVQIDNLDSLAPPAQVFEPTDNPYALEHLLNIGTLGDARLNVGANLTLFITGDSPMAMYNELEVVMSADSAELGAEVLALMSSNGLLHFPIGDLMNLNCWLATIPPPELDESGKRVLGSANAGIDLASIVTKLKSLAIQARCIECDSPGFELLSELTELLQFTGVTEAVGNRLNLFVEEMMESDTMQTALDRTLHNARMKCPHSQEQGSSNALKPFDGFPSMSEDSIDTLELMTVVAMEIALVVFAETQRLIPVETVDPLSGQKALETPDDVTLIDFAQNDTRFAPLADLGLESIRQDLGATFMDTATGEEDLGINNYMREMLDEDDDFVMAFQNLDFGDENFMFKVNGIRASGLDSFTQFDVLEVLASQTFQNRIKMESLGLELNFTIGSPSAPRDMIMHFQVDGLDMTMPILAAVDKDLLTSLELGSLLFSEEILPCFMSTVRKLMLPQMLVSVEKIHTPKFSGLSQESADIVENFINTIWSFYYDKILSATPSIFDNFLRSIINILAETYISSNSICENKMLHSISSSRGLLTAVSTFVDFRDLLLPAATSEHYGGSGDSPYGDVASLIWLFLNNNIGSVEDAVATFNSNIVTELTEAFNGEAGTVFFGSRLNQDSRATLGGSDVGIGIKISNARIGNVDALDSPFQLLNAVTSEPYLLDNQLTVGTESEPLTVGANLLVEFDSEDGEVITNNIDVTFDFKAASVLLTTLIKMEERKLANFPLGDVLNPYCWLASIPSPSLDMYGVRHNEEEPSVSLTNLAATIAKLNMNVNCIECASPGLEEWANLLTNQDLSEDLTTMTNNYLTYLSGLVGGSYLQIQIDRILNEAPRRCPHSPMYDELFLPTDYRVFETENVDESVPLLAIAGMLTAAIATVLLALVFSLQWLVRRRHQLWLQSLSNEQIFHLKQQQDKDQQLATSLDDSTQSMFTSSDIPFMVRLLMPAVIAINIFCFLNGHFSRGARVAIEATIAGEYLKIDEYHEFSMVEATTAMWQAGGKELATLIFILSFIWPYMKQLATFVIWFLPTKVVSTSRRGSVLLWLDTFGKWSIFDIFVFMVAIACSRISIETPDARFLTPDLYSINLLVVPLKGLYLNLIAQVLAQVSSHVILYYHRTIVQQGLKVYMHSGGADLTNHDEFGEWDPYGRRKDQLCAHAYARAHRGDNDKLVVRSYMNAVLVFAAAAISALFISGFVAPAISVEHSGLIGAAMVAGEGSQEAAKYQDSTRGFTRVLKDEGMGGLGDILFLTVLLVPLLQTIALLVSWFHPMTGKSRKSLSVILEVLQGWQYAEVYILAFFAASWQLGPLSEWMFNAYCTELNETLTNLVYYGLLDVTVGQCFQVNATVNRAAYFLLGGAAMLALFNKYITKASEQYFRDRHIDNDKHRSRVIFKQTTTTPLSVPVAAKTVYEGEDSKNNSAIFRGGRTDAAVIDAYEVASVAATEDLNLSWDEEDDRYDAEKKIRPIPLLFTDRFRWTLKREIKLQQTSKSALLSGKQFDRMLVAADGLFVNEDKKEDPNENHYLLPQATLVGLESQDAAETNSHNSIRVVEHHPQTSSRTSSHESAASIAGASVMSSHSELLMSTSTRSPRNRSFMSSLASITSHNPMQQHQTPPPIDEQSVATFQSEGTIQTADMTYRTGVTSAGDCGSRVDNGTVV